MKKTILQLVAVTAILAAASAAQADISIIPTMAPVFKDAGVTALPANSLVVFVADVDGDGFGYDAAHLLGADGFLVDPDDHVLGMKGSGGQDILITETYKFYNPADYVGKNFGVLWFDTAYTPGAIGAGADVNYGFWNITEDTGVVVPDDNSNTIYFWIADTPGNGGTVPVGSFYANYTTTPEPATMALLAIGGGLLAARRRRKSA